MSRIVSEQPPEPISFLINILRSRRSSKKVHLCHLSLCVWSTPPTDTPTHMHSCTAAVQSVLFLSDVDICYCLFADSCCLIVGDSCLFDDICGLLTLVVYVCLFVCRPCSPIPLQPTGKDIPPLPSSSPSLSRDKARLQVRGTTVEARQTSSKMSKSSDNLRPSSSPMPGVYV